MDRKGFTLIELVMVILILGIVALVCVPTVNVLIKNSKKQAYDSQVKMIEDVARNYMAKHSTELPDQVNDSSVCLTVEMLKKDGLLSKDDIQNPSYKENGEESYEAVKVLNGAVKVSWNGLKYVYTYYESSDC